MSGSVTKTVDAVKPDNCANAEQVARCAETQSGDVKWDVIAGTFSVICGIAASLDASASVSDSEELFVRIIFAPTPLK